MQMALNLIMVYHKTITLRCGKENWIKRFQVRQEEMSLHVYHLNINCRLNTTLWQLKQKYNEVMAVLRWTLQVTMHCSEHVTNLSTFWLLCLTDFHHVLIPYGQASVSLSTQFTKVTTSHFICIIGLNHKNRLDIS